MNHIELQNTIQNVLLQIYKIILLKKNSPKHTTEAVR